MKEGKVFYAVWRVKTRTRRKERDNREERPLQMIMRGAIEA